jgi:hypothetical protein
MSHAVPQAPQLSGSVRKSTHAVVAPLLHAVCPAEHITLGGGMSADGPSDELPSPDEPAPEQPARRATPTSAAIPVPGTRRVRIVSSLAKRPSGESGAAAR